MDADVFMNKIPAKSPRSVLVKLEEYCHAKSGQEGFLRPEVTLLVNSVNISGLFYKLGSDDNQEFVTLYSDKESSFITLPSLSIVALTVKNADKFSHILSFGNIARPLNEPQLGSMALLNGLKTNADAINSLCGANLKLDAEVVKDNPTANANVADIGKLLEAAIKNIAVDNFVKDAVKTIASIKIINAGDGTIILKRNGGDVTLESKLTDGLPLSAQTQIESGLNSIL